MSYHKEFNVDRPAEGKESGQLTEETRYSSDRGLDQILADFALKIDERSGDGLFNSQDLANLTFNSPSPDLKDEFSKLADLVGAQKKVSSGRIAIWLFDRESALCARAAFELRCQGYSQGETGRWLRGILVHPGLVSRISGDFPQEAKFMPKQWYSLARRKRERLSRRKLKIGLLPIGHFDPEYAKVVVSSLAPEFDDRQREFVGGPKEDEENMAVFTRPPVSGETLESLSEPSLFDIEEAIRAISMWNQLDSLSTVKLLELRQFGFDISQVRTIIFAHEFESGMRKVDFDLYTYSWLRQVFIWWRELKERKEITLSDVVAKIEKRLEAENSAREKEEGLESVKSKKKLNCKSKE